MSLWGAEPLHPRVRRTPGSEVAARRAEEGPAEGGWAGGPGAVRKGGRLGTGEPRGARGCVESPEDCGHASQLRQQRLQLQPLSAPQQTGRVLPSDSPGKGGERAGLPPPALGAERPGDGWWQEPFVRLKTQDLR